MRERQSSTIKNHAAFIWSVADLLRGDYKQSEYGKDSVLRPYREHHTGSR